MYDVDIAIWAILPTHANFETKYVNFEIYKANVGSKNSKSKKIVYLVNSFLYLIISGSALNFSLIH